MSANRRVAVKTGKFDASSMGGGDRPRALLAWAVRSDTRRATHIGMLSRKETGLACACVCAACGGPVQAVNAGRPVEHFEKPGSLRPFFRHEARQETDSCLVHAARLAALQLLLDCDEIDLPPPSARRSVVGASGTVYTREALGAAKRSALVDRQWVDEQAARITLEDGRVVLLQLIGRITGEAEGTADAIISINVNDPEVASWPPEEILRRAQLDGHWLCWERHWDDDELGAKAEAAAQAEARRLLDLPPEDCKLPEGQTPLQKSESILHWAIKDILAGAGRISVPAAQELVAKQMPDGQTSTRRVSIPAMTLELSDVRVEYPLGGLKPDLLCRAVDARNRIPSMELLIEVAVTNRVKDVKKDRIKERGLACIEFDVDLVSAAGRVTKAQLRSVVVDEVESKRWIHHPELQRYVNIATEDIARIIRIREAELLRAARQTEWFSAMPIDQAINEYLDCLRHSWTRRRPTASNGSVWDVKEMGSLLENRDMDQLTSPEFSRRNGLLWKLDTIRRATLTSVEPGLICRILDEVCSDGSQERHFAGLILLAIRMYPPLVTSDEADAIAARRKLIRESIERGESTYARPPTWDTLIAKFFPEMAAGLRKEKGTTAYASRIARERSEAKRKADEEQRAKDAARREADRQQAQAAALEREIEVELALAERMSWAQIDGGIPQDAAIAERLLRNSHSIGPSVCDSRVTALVKSAWAARANGIPIRTWILSHKPSCGHEVTVLRRILVDAWLAEERTLSRGSSTLRH